jgi:hypothetical protein
MNIPCNKLCREIKGIFHRRACGRLLQIGNQILLSAGCVGFADLNEIKSHGFNLRKYVGWRFELRAFVNRAKASGMR